MEEMIIKFFSEYGLVLTLIACSGILLLGILKFFKVFDKIEKEKRKYIYAAVSSGFSILASAIYLACTSGFEAKSFGVIAAAIYMLNQAVYSVYETFGLREGVKKFGDIIINIIAGNRINEAIQKNVAASGSGEKNETIE